MNLATSYIPQNNAITGSSDASILLQRVLSLYMDKGKEPFRMFREPCPTNESYATGEIRSWAEELDFSPHRIATALARIGTKITKGVSKNEALQKTDPTGLVLYWTDADRVTSYLVNIGLFKQLALMAAVTWDEQP